MGVGKSTLVQSMSTLLGTRATVNPHLLQPVQIYEVAQTKGNMGERFKVQFIDCPGIQAHITPTNITSIESSKFDGIIEYIEHQFDKTLIEETKLLREKIDDSHIHLVIYVFDPVVIVSHKGLSEMDRLFLSRICGKTNIVCCIGKMDIMTKKEHAFLIALMNDQLAKFDLLLTKEQVPELAKVFTVMNGELDEKTNQPTFTREYSWGLVFTSSSELKELVDTLLHIIADLKTSTKDEAYQEYRTKKLTTLMGDQSTLVNA